jgi:hypothetical protein
MNSCYICANNVSKQYKFQLYFYLNFFFSFTSSIKVFYTYFVKSGIILSVYDRDVPFR